jgi:type IV secretory pathway VirB2 component (pilin)
MFHKFKTLIAITLIMMLAIPLFAGAVDEKGLVPCAAGECNFCDLLTMLQNILNFITKYVLVTGAIIFLMIGGFNMITSGGSPAKYKKGWDIIKATLIGVVIAFSAWFLVNTVLNILAVKENGEGMNLPWDKIECDYIKPPITPGGGGDVDLNVE